MYTPSWQLQDQATPRCSKEPWLGITYILHEMRASTVNAIKTRLEHCWEVVGICSIYYCCQQYRRLGLFPIRNCALGKLCYNSCRLQRISHSRTQQHVGHLNRIIMPLFSFLQYKSNRHCACYFLKECSCFLTGSSSAMTNMKIPALSQVALKC